MSEWSQIRRYNPLGPDYPEAGRDYVLRSEAEEKIADLQGQIQLIEKNLDGKADLMAKVTKRQECEIAGIRRPIWDLIGEHGSRRLWVSPDITQAEYLELLDAVMEMREVSVEIPGFLNRSAYITRHQIEMNGWCAKPRYVFELSAVNFAEKWVSDYGRAGQ